jgi:sugar lactone lactonase YvrE
MILYCSLDVNAVKVSPCAEWNRTGVTVAGNGRRGNSTDQLTFPKSIFINKPTNTLYVADSRNKRIQMFSLDEQPSKAITVMSTQTEPSRIYVIENANKGLIIYIAFEYENYVSKWTSKSSIATPIGPRCPGCSDVSVDKEKNVYMVARDEHCVFKWSPQTNITTIVAGQKNESGKTDQLLRFPNGFYIDQISDSVYVADTWNERIQKWINGSEKGITVAGSNDGFKGDDAASSSSPNSVWVDEETHTIYVADTVNDRIQRWLQGALEGVTIAGGHGMYTVQSSQTTEAKGVNIKLLQLSVDHKMILPFNKSLSVCSRI